MVSAINDRLARAVLPGYGMKTPVLCASTAALALTGLPTIDGITVSSGDRVLEWNQPAAYLNGVYVAGGSSWERDADFDGNTDVRYGTLIPVSAGTAYGGKIGRVISTGSGNNGEILFGAGTSTSDAITFDMLATFGSSTFNFSSTTTQVLDNSFSVLSHLDVTAGFKFSATGITTGQTRTLTAPDANTSLVGTTNAQTLTNKTLTGMVSSGALMSGTTSSGGTFNSGLFDGSTFGASSTNVHVGAGTIFAHSTDASARFRFSAALIGSSQTRVVAVQDSSQTICALDVASQTITGGANITPLSVNSSTGLAINYGNRPTQFTTNNSSSGFTITASTKDGNCVLLVTNSTIAGTITLSGFNVGSNTGDTYATSSGARYKFYFDTVNAISSYAIRACS